MSLRPMTTARRPAIGMFGPLEQLDDAGRRARREGAAILDELPDVDRMEAVDVLLRIERVEHPPLGVGAHRVGQRRLHEDPVVHVAAIQPVDERQQRRRGSPSPAAARCRRAARSRRPTSACC